MKVLNIKSIFILSILILSNSCYDLDRFPLDKANSATFWQTDEQAKMGILGAYTKLKGWDESKKLHAYGYGMLFANDCMSDIGMGYDEPGYYRMQTGVYSAYTTELVSKWQSCYDGVQAANIVIRNVQNSKTISENVKNQIVGEAKFLRSLFYFHLMDHWGGVPLYDESTNIDDDFNRMLKPRSSIEDTRAFIIKDLTDAIELLPIMWPADNYGRATRGAAYAMRGKVYLFAQDYDNAYKDFEEIVLKKSTYRYGLYPDYAKLFLPKEIGGGDESNEIIFAIQNGGGWGKRYGIPTMFYMGSRSAYKWSWNCSMPSKSLVDMYEMKDGKKFNWNEHIPGFNESQDVRNRTYLATLSTNKSKVTAYPEHLDSLLNMYEQRDPRMRQTIILPYDHYTGWASANVPEKDYEFVVAQGTLETNGFMRSNYPSVYHFFWRKLVGEGDLKGLITDRDHSPINFPIIRYADVLLMLAECYNELGRYDEAVTYINEVRKRPSTNMPALNSGPVWLEARTKEEIFKRIMHERAVELAGEGLRFSDIKRWRLGEELLNRDELQITGEKAYTRVFTSRDYLWPIPAAEIDMNPQLKPNNPGW